MFKIVKGKQKRAVRACIYGAEGIGKSTLASKLPDPLFIDAEGGTYQIDCNRFDQPKTWGDVIAMIDYVNDNPDLCKTLVIDTADKVEAMLTEAILAEDGVKSIEKVGGGYGKGYTILAERFHKELLQRLDKCIQKGINVCFTAHAAMRKFESPEDAPYDRWELKCSKKVSPLIKEWADLLLFCNYDVFVVEDGGKNKARGAGKRVMHANHKPTYDAKNRYGLPDDMPMKYDPIRGVFEGTTPQREELDTLRVDSPVEGIVDNENPAEESVFDVLKRMLKSAGITQKKLMAYLIDRGKAVEGADINDLSVPYINSLVDNFDMLKAEIAKGENK